MEHKKALGNNILLCTFYINFVVTLAAAHYLAVSFELTL
jgi:hypothetical protein